VADVLVIGAEAAGTAQVVGAAPAGVVAEVEVICDIIRSQRLDIVPRIAGTNGLGVRVEGVAVSVVSLVQRDRSCSGGVDPEGTEDVRRMEGVVVVDCPVSCVGLDEIDVIPGHWLPCSASTARGQAPVGAEVPPIAAPDPVFTGCPGGEGDEEEQHEDDQGG